MDKGPEGQRDPNGSDNDAAEAARQEALKRLGVFAAYTAPTTMVLLSTKIASAQAVMSGDTG